MDLTSSDVSIVPRESSLPSPMLHRGVWFSGSSTMDVKDLVLNTIFTVEIWLRPT